MAMVIVGMACYLAGFLLAELQDVNSAGNGTLASRARAAVTRCSCNVATSLELAGLLLTTVGCLLELTLGQLSVFIGFSQDYLLIAKTIVSFALNSTLSRLVTVMVATTVRGRRAADVEGTGRLPLFENALP